MGPVSYQLHFHYKSHGLTTYSRGSALPLSVSVSVSLSLSLSLNCYTKGSGLDQVQSANVHVLYNINMYMYDVLYNNLCTILNGFVASGHSLYVLQCSHTHTHTHTQLYAQSGALLVQCIVLYIIVLHLALCSFNYCLFIV